MILIPARAGVYGEVWFDEKPPADAGVDVLRFRRLEWIVQWDWFV